MLYYVHHLDHYLAGLNVFRYVTFRTAGASITALAIGLLLGPWMIRKLREFQIGQVVRQEGHNPVALARAAAASSTFGLDSAYLLRAASSSAARGSRAASA